MTALRRRRVHAAGPLCRAPEPLPAITKTDDERRSVRPDGAGEPGPGARRRRRSASATACRSTSSIATRAWRASGDGDLHHRAHDAHRPGLPRTRSARGCSPAASIDANDRDGAERVVLLSEPLARQLFPAGDPIGSRVDLCARRRRAAKLHRRRHDRRSGVDADGQPAAAAVPARWRSSRRSTVLVIARGAPSDPSIRGAFDNAIAGGLRMLARRAAIPMPCSAS